MSTAYRLLHYEPNPFAETRFLFGALFRQGNRVWGAPARRLPGAECLGGAGHASVVALMARQLGQMASETQALMGLGPYVHFSDWQVLPQTIENPQQWVQQHILSPGIQISAESVQHRAPRVSSQGQAFFRTYKVDKYVKKTFDPEVEGSRWLGKPVSGLQAITHWVGGMADLLLMEPILPERRQLEEDLNQIATRFLAWRQVLSTTHPTPQGQLVAYVLAGGEEAQRERVVALLYDKVDLLVDTTQEQERTRLVEWVREVGQSGEASAS